MDAWNCGRASESERVKSVLALHSKLFKFPMSQILTANMCGTAGKSGNPGQEGPAATAPRTGEAGNPQAVPELFGG
jgi:hypothetical protein